MSRALAVVTHDMDKGKVKRVGEYVIEQGIPLPVRASPLVDALVALEVGESFVHRKRINVCAIRKAGAGKKFIQRCVVKGGAQHRIWRTK